MTTSLPDGVIPTPAANSRSPNRQPRYRGAVRAWLREEQWRVYLSVYALHGKEAAEKAITTPCVGDLEQDEAIQNTRDRVRKWVNENPEEKVGRLAQLSAACKLWEQRQKDRHDSLQASIQPRVDGLVDASLGVMGETLGDVTRKDLRHDAAKTVLKGVGILGERAKIELTGKDGEALVPTFVFVLPDGTRQTAKEMLADGHSDRE